MAARDTILRRRAAFMASALGGLAAATASVDTARAEPAVVSPTHEAEAYEKARAHQRLGQLEDALAALATVNDPGVDTLLLRGRLLRELGRFAAARTAFALAWPRLHDPDRVVVVAREMDDLAERTAKLELTVYPDFETTILVDGQAAGVTPLPELFVDPGHHTITAQHDGYPPVVREIDVAGGAELTLDLMVTEPRVCLSMLPPNYERARAGLHFSVGVGPHALVNIAREGGTPLLGAALTASLSVGMGPFGFQAGPVGGVYGSARGTSALGGVRVESRVVSPLDFLAIGLGTTAGYLYVPDEPEEPELDGYPGLRTTASFCVIPDAGFTLSIGPIDAGPRIGVVLSRAEEDGVGTFGPTYLSTMMWVTYVHRGDPYDYE